MSIDNRNKRASALNSVPVVIAPLADGVIDGNDRQQITWLYAGIVAGVPVVIVILTPADRTYRVPYSPRWWPVESEDRLLAVTGERRFWVVDNETRSLRVEPEIREIVV